MIENPLHRRLVAVAALILIGGIAFSLGALVQNRTGPVEIHGVLLNPPRDLPAFQLIDEAEQAFTQQDFRGAWSFIYFGYSFCPDVCPMSLAQMALIRKRLDAAGFDQPQGYYLVSVDPERDTPSRLREYVGYFDPSFKGLSGDPGEIDTFAKTAGIAYQLPADRSDPDYLVSHSSVIVLINPDGAIHAYFTSPLDGDVIAADFLRLVD